MMGSATAGEGVRPEQVDSLISKIGNRTQRRVNALRWAGEGSVEYDPIAATWLVRDEVLGGWDFRTLTELRRTGAIVVREVVKGEPVQSNVDLTAEGRALLERWLD